MHKKPLPRSGPEAQRIWGSMQYELRKRRKERNEEIHINLPSDRLGQDEKRIISREARQGHVREHFLSYIPCAGNERIRIADGSLAPIAGKGKIYPCAGLSLHNVLHVPRLSYNLLSISKITHEWNCKAIFLPDSVSFQDLSSGRMIGTARHSRGLYLLDDDTSSSSISRTSLLSSYFTTSEQDCMLWHFRLGHPNFQYMKDFFPHLFSKIDVSTATWASQFHRTSDASRANFVP